MPGLAPLIERHPEIPVIINHMGMPVPTDADGVEDWRKGLKALAAFPHVAIKLSGMGFIRRDWTRETVEPLVREAIDIFGADRCAFASDTPTDKLFAPIDRYMEAYHAIVADFSDEDRRALFGRNANRIYRLGLSL
jgi:predicted TIM-barrel fold metal-dependent hydrolase